MIMQTFPDISLQTYDTIMIHLNIAFWEVVTHSTLLLQDSGWVCLLSMTLSERLVMSSGKSCPQWNCQNLKLEIGKELLMAFTQGGTFPTALGHWMEST